MDFFSKIKISVRLTSIALLVISPLYAADVTPLTQAAPKLEIIDGFYAAYPKTTPGKDQSEQDLVSRGEYLAKTGDCIACHTNVQGGTPAYAGGLPIATPFGTFYSPNITPDKDTGIGTWTDNEFVAALKEGHAPDGSNYFPVYPFVYFSNVSDADALALAAYFRHIPAVHQVNKSLPFPFNVPGARMTLLGWNLLFFYPNTPFANDPAQSPVWNRGKYLVDGLGHCSMCHTPLNPLGAPKNRYYLSGGFIDGYWAPNITSAGLAGNSIEEIADVFVNNQLLNQAGPVTGPMSEVNHDSLRYLTREDQLAIATYLKTVVSDDALALPGSEKPPTLQRGQQVYNRVCTICHQEGQMSAPIIGNSSNWYQRYKQVGLHSLYQHAIKGYNSMPIKGACVTCSDSDIRAAVNYILDRSLTRSQQMNLAADGEENAE